MDLQELHVQLMELGRTRSSYVDKSCYKIGDFLLQEYKKGERKKKRIYTQRKKKKKKKKKKKIQEKSETKKELLQAFYN